MIIIIQVRLRNNDRGKHDPRHKICRSRSDARCGRSSTTITMMIDMLSYSHVTVDHHHHQDNFYLYKDSLIIGRCVDALLPSYHLCLHWEPQGNYQHLQSCRQPYTSTSNKNPPGTSVIFS